MGFNAASLKTVMLKAAADATIKTAVYGGSFKDNLGSALLNTAASAGGAVAAGKIGDLVGSTAASTKSCCMPLWAA
jgi:filamentous hemagglutinin